jgi:hypothetical protein
MRPTINFKGIATADERWEIGTEHDPRAERLARLLGDIDFQMCDDSMCLKYRGDGDNGDQLTYLLDIYFELLDKGRTNWVKTDAF